MRKKLNKILATAILTITLSSYFVVLGEPLPEEIQNKNKYIQDERNKLENIRREKEELEIKIEKFDASIEKIMREVESGEIEKGQIEADIKKTEEKININEEELEKNKELFNERMRSIYMNSSDGELELLLNSDGLDDFLTRAEYAKTLGEYHKKLKLTIEDKEKELKVSKAELENQFSRVEDILAEKEAKLLSFNEKREDQEKLLQEIKKYEDTTVTNIQNTEEYINKTVAKSNNIAKVPVTENRPSRGKKNVSADEVLVYAKRFLGIPYLWGGTRPETGFDCSGFTQYVYAQFGIKVGRTTYDQIKDGPRIKKANLKPGDLVFFGTWSNPHHMGIYLGNNKYIHSPRTGDVLKISPMTRRDFVTGVRVL